MTTVLCTLYNSLYLDKGLVLYDSLCKYAKDFKLYVLCMDDKCYEVLVDLKQEHHIPVRLCDFEAGDEDLLAAKANRPFGEYCWTCSSSFIRYVLKHYNEDSCTYIDADMYFYNDPQVLIDEMLAAGKSVMVVPHRFSNDNIMQAAKVGQYCVEFNTFLNNNQGIEVLEYWRNRCIECCSNIGDGIHWGDQKYLEELVEKYSCVHVCQNIGAGVAPWNILSYYSSSSSNKLTYKPTDKNVELIFYHFQSIVYINNNLIDVCLKKEVDSNLVNILYKPYLFEISSKKNLIAKRYGIIEIIHSHPAGTGYFRWLKRTWIGQWILFLKRSRQDRLLLKI